MAQRLHVHAHRFRASREPLGPLLTKCFFIWLGDLRTLGGELQRAPLWKNNVISRMFPHGRRHLSSGLCRTSKERQRHHRSNPQIESIYSKLFFFCMTLVLGFTFSAPVSVVFVCLSLCLSFAYFYMQSLWTKALCPHGCWSSTFLNRINIFSCTRPCIQALWR